MTADGDTDTPMPGGDAALAAEYVLGLLSVPEVREIEARIAIEPALAAEVAFWQDSFADLALEDVAPVAPPPQLRSWTETEIFGGVPQRRSGRRRWPAFLGGLFLGGGAVALGLGAFLVVQSSLRLPFDLPPGLIPPASPGYIARVDSPVAEMVALVRTTAGGRAGLLEVSMLRTSPPEGRDLELWLLPVGEPPMSLGLVPGSGRVSVALGSALTERLAGAFIAISDEPPGGSPSGLPTGQVRATVPLTAL